MDKGLLLTVLLWATLFWLIAGIVGLLINRIDLCLITNISALLCLIFFVFVSKLKGGLK